MRRTGMFKGKLKHAFVSHSILSQCIEQMLCTFFMEIIVSETQCAKCLFEELKMLKRDMKDEFLDHRVVS